MDLLAIARHDRQHRACAEYWTRHARMPIFRAVSSHRRWRTASLPGAGEAQRRFCHDQRTADAEGDCRMAGREHRALVRPSRGILQAPSAGGEGDCRRRCRPGIKGLDPILTGQLTREEIAKAEDDSDYRLHLANPKVRLPEAKRKKGPRYTPVSRRQDRPNAILWLLRNHPELKDAQIMRLVGTTKPTIEAIRTRTHWNATSLQPLDPVTLGLCSQIDLDFEVEKASKTMPQPAEQEGATLLPAAETTSAAAALATASKTSAQT